MIRLFSVAPDFTSSYIIPLRPLNPSDVVIGPARKANDSASLGLVSVELSRSTKEQLANSLNVSFEPIELTIELHIHQLTRDLIEPINLGRHQRLEMASIALTYFQSKLDDVITYHNAALAVAEPQTHVARNEQGLWH